MKRLGIAIALALLAAAMRPALAADPVFPLGARVGLTPLVGLSVSKTFPGFVSDDQKVKVLVTELPRAAYDEVKSAFANPAATAAIKPESIQTAAGVAYYTAETAKVGTDTVRRYSMILSGGPFSGYVAVQIPQDAAKIYTDDAVRKMFASAVVRKDVPVDEQLGLMPFKVTELAKFKTVQTLAPGAALIIADGDETKGFETAPYMVIAIMGGTPPEQGDRARFAQEAAAGIPALRESHITMSESIRINGMQAYETRVDGTSGKNNTPVTVVQWLRFGNANTLRIIGSAPRDQWTSAFPRFRAVRDGIQTRD